VDPHHFNADPDHSFQIRLKSLEKCSNRLIFACHLQIDADLEAVLDAAYYFDAESEC
jgi:hypothetical protein